MSFRHTPLIFHEKPTWGPIVKSFFHSEEKESQEQVDYLTLSADEFRSKIQHLIERHSEQFHEMNELDDLLRESHYARVSYIRSLGNQRLRQDRREKRQEHLLRREQKREEKRKLREQNRVEKEKHRLEREAEILRYTIEQREHIRKQARLFRQIKRDQEEQARLKEIADGWKTVSYKRTKKNANNSRSKY
jgi:hypothetical protein